MKWQSIKNKVVAIAWEQYKKEAVYEPSKVQVLLMRLNLNDELASLRGEHPDRPIGDALKMKLWEQIKATIDNWDIRRWKALKDLYPKAFPKGNLTPDLTMDGGISSFDVIITLCRKL